jgi:hypothetical protein
MSSYVDQKYVNMLSPKLPKFGWIKPKVAACRCPLCGDSKHNKTKRRFYLYEHKNHFVVKCHNCGYSSTFSHFLEKHDSNLYQEYRVESFKEHIGTQFNIRKDAPASEGMTFTKPVFKTDPLADCTTIAELPDDHPAKAYVLGRKIPQRHHGLLRYHPSFREVAARLDPEASARCPKDGRLLIPFFTKTGELFCIQGRSLLPHSAIRYITIRDKNHDDAKVYGLERFDEASQSAYCVEGPIDSLFLGNCLAMAGADVPLDSIPQQCTFVFDNECRNLEILKRMERVAALGRPLCVWPDWVRQKDVNDMVTKGGLTNIEKIINDNTFSGLGAKLALTRWRKV